MTLTVKEILENQILLLKGKAADGIHYSVNQKEYLKVFLTDGKISIYDSASELVLRNFTFERKNLDDYQYCSWSAG